MNNNKSHDDLNNTAFNHHLLSNSSFKSYQYKSSAACKLGIYIAFAIWLAVATQAFADTCPADICIYDTVSTPLPVGSQPESGLTVYSGGPDKIAKDLHQLEETLNNFSAWLGSLIPSSTTPIRNRDTQEFTAAMGQNVKTKSATAFPHSDAERKAFSSTHLDGPNLSPIDARINPYANSVESLMTPAKVLTQPVHKHPLAQPSLHWLQTQ